MYCINCGAALPENGAFCPSCGTPVAPAGQPFPPQQPQYQQQQYQQPYPAQQQYDSAVYSDKEKLITLLLCIFVGSLGVHRFYVGKIGTGVLWLLTIGLFGIGTLVDIITIATGSFTDSDGMPLRP